MPLDDVVFGEFNLAAPMNGPESSIDDDNDWGDFVDSTGLNRATGLVPAATSAWDKPRGALPLSIFGLEDSATAESTLEFDPKSSHIFKNNNGVSRNLISESYRFDSNSEKGNVNALNFDQNGLDLGSLSSNRNGFNEVTKVLPFDPLSSKGNGVKFDTKVANLVSSRLNQNGFNFTLDGLDLDALSSNQDSKMLAFDSLSSKINEVKLDMKVESLDSLSLNQNRLNLDSKVPPLVVEDKSLSARVVGQGFVSDNGGFSDGNEDEEDDGWEFQGAEWKASDEPFKSGQSNTENGPVSNFNEPNSIWNIPNSDKLVTSSSANGISSDAQQMYFNLRDKNDDFWGSGKWEFMLAESQPITGHGNAKDDEKKPESSSNSMYAIGFGNDAQEVGDFFGISLGVTQQPNKQDSAFDSKPSLLTENSSLSNIYSTAKENDTENKLSVDGKSDNDEDSWVFKDAFPEIGSKKNYNGHSADGKSDNDEDSRVFKDAFPEIGSKKNDNGHSVDGKSYDNENSWAFKDAFSEIGLKDTEQPHDTEVSSAVEALQSHREVKENKIRSDNHKGALPLSIFGDEEEVDDPAAFQDMSMQIPNSSHADGIKNHHANIPISDLLSSLYGQAEKNSSVNHAQSPGEDGLGSTDAIMPSDIKSAANDFDDNSWDFEDASSQLQANDTVKSSNMNNHVTDLFSSLHGQAEKNTSSHTQSSSKNGLLSTNTGINPNLPNGGDTFGDNSWDFKHSFPEENIDEDFDGDTWEFKDASSGIESEDQTGAFDAVRPTKVDKTDYLDFFPKLKGALHLVALCHLENLKKAQSDADVTGKDSRLEALNKEVQGLENVLCQDGLISSELQSDYSSSRNVSLNEFVEVLKEPKYQSFESDFQLSNKLTQVEDSPTLVIELLKYVNSTVKILALLSVEEQFIYVSTWSRILSVCTQELKHGAMIWKQALQRNAREQILSVPQGKKQIIALGEIFRVVELLGCSIRLYKQWILASSVDAAGIMSLLSECSTLWSSSGLKEALGSILDLDGLEYDGSPWTLIESIGHIHNLDIFTLYDHAFSGQDTICHMSLLKPGTVPGIKTVVWNGEQYFLPLANLWANLISPDAPSLPSMHVR